MQSISAFAPKQQLLDIVEPNSGQVDKASVTEAVGPGSISGQVKLKTIKIGIYTFLS